jgi:hypothetical protein
MCYTRKDRDDLEREARRITESRLMEEGKLAIGMRSISVGESNRRSR